MMLLLGATLFVAGFLRFYNLSSRPIFKPDEELTIKVGRFYFLGTPTGYGFAFRNGEPDIYGTPHPYNYEHPPLAKYLVGLSTLVFGDTPFGSRVVTAFLGTLSVLVLFFIAKKLFGGFPLALLSSLFLALEPLHVGMSRTAMLDIYMLFFELLALLALVYLQDRPRVGYPVVGALMGAALASKWLAAYGIIAWIGYALYRVFYKDRPQGRSRKESLLFLLLGGAVMVTVYTASYLPYFLLDNSGNPEAGSLAKFHYLDLSRHNLGDFINLQSWMLEYMLSWHAVGGMYGFVFRSPLNYLIPNMPEAPVLWINPVLFLLSILAASFMLVYNLFFRERQNELYLLCWFGASMIGLVQRGFVWYLLFSVPAMALIASWTVNEVMTVPRLSKVGKFTAVIFILLVLLSGAWFFPAYPGYA